ncbi:2Fe-2S iron-sulfur cluster-binding protein [Streptomyces anandii]|uniref:2Fe-2S iron-sulfur cluster-binding protein n=1 Tax=Streptomyces anandii TaxID=285454 RepID=UPI003694E7A4
MTDDQHAEGARGSGGRWDPLPQGDYDDGATAFVKLPEGGIDALLAADSPLAAPGHGYVPPQITVTSAPAEAADPSATGSWAVPGAPAGGARWPDPNAVPRDADTGEGADDRFTYRPGATQQWTFEDAQAGGGTEQAPSAHGPSGHGPSAHGPSGHGPDAAGHDVTGQWSIPVAGGDLPDESGEFTTSSLVQQWGGTPPATLPGGAPAPWATEPWGRPEPGGEGDPARRPEAGEVSAQAAMRPAPGTGELAGAVDDGDGSDGTEGAEDREGALEAAGGPAEPLAQPAVDEETGHAARAAEEPLSGPGPAAASAAAPETAPADADPAHARDPHGSQDAHGARDPHGSQDAHGSPEEAAPADGPDDAPQGHEAHDPPPSAHDEHPLASYVLRVNGVDRPVTDAWIGESLLYVLRERLGLAGAKDGCSQGECGACNVQVDGRLVASCLVPAVTAAGSEVRTVEGLAADGQPSDVQRALARCGAVQCGFCVPGMAMTVHDLLEGNPAPTELETRQALCGNLCRCSGYRGVLEAVKEVVAEREAQSAAEGEQDGDEPRIPHQAGPGAGGVHPSAFEPREPHGPYGQDGGQA